MLRRRRVWIGLAVSLFFLALFFYRTDFSQITDALRQANYVYLVPALVAYFVAVLFRSMRWRYLLLPLKSFTSRRLFSIVIIGYMANNLLPVRMGELVRAYILGSKENLSKTSILGTIVAERILDGLALLTFLVAVSLFVPLADWLRDVARVMALVFLLALVFLFVLTMSAKFRSWFEAVLRLLPRGIGLKASQLVSLFAEGLIILKSPYQLIFVFLLSLLVWFFEAVMYYVVVFSFDFRQPFYVLLLMTAAANLAITLPSSQGGIGPFEFFAARTLTLFGVSASIATAYAIVLHAVLLVPVIILGLFYLWLENLSLPEVIGGRNRIASEKSEQVLPKEIVT